MASPNIASVTIGEDTFRAVGVHFGVSTLRHFLQSARAKRFKKFLNGDFSLHRVRTAGAETVYLGYSGREFDGEIEAEEAVDGGISIVFDRTAALQELDELARLLVAADIHVAMGSQGIACQIVDGHRVV